MEKYGKLIAKDTLRFERILPGPIENVWEFLVDGEKRGRWFASGDMELKPGGDATFIFDHSRLSPEDDPVPEKYIEHENGSTSKAVVIDCDPPHTLAIEWEGIVRFELQDEGDLVKLTLTHERLTAEKDARIGVMAGWHTHLDILVDHVKGVSPKGFWGVHMGREEEYEQMLG